MIDLMSFEIVITPMVYLYLRTGATAYTTLVITHLQSVKRVCFYVSSFLSLSPSPSQYSSSLKQLLQILAISMASYDQWYRADKSDPVRRLLQRCLVGILGPLCLQCVASIHNLILCWNGVSEVVECWRISLFGLLSI